MKRELVRGITVGDNPQRVARDLVRKAEGRFNGGLTRAMTIARTETLDAHREATKASERVNSDIIGGWEWYATLDAMTCPACLAMHGSVHDAGEPGPVGHQNCRCARLTVTKSWAELGFNDIEEPPSLTQDPEAWFNGLTEDTQRQIMGPERLELLQSGQIKWSDLAMLQHNHGWRDSYHPTPLKRLRPVA